MKTLFISISTVIFASFAGHLVSAEELRAESTNVFASEQSCQWQTRPDQYSEFEMRYQMDQLDPLPTPQPGMTVANIRFKRLNIFNADNPDENNALFNFANKIHLITDESVINNILLFQSGDPYDPKLILESERMLRNQRYLYDARIKVEQTCADQVDVTVITRELWTLMPEVDFSRTGGQNSSSLGIRDTNLLGWGKRLSMTYNSDEERSGYNFIYEDPNIWGSRYQGRLEYGDNDDGERHYVDLSLPFYSVSTPYSYGMLSYANNRTESLYRDGLVVSQYQQHSKINSAYFATSSQSEQWIRRLSFGIQVEDHQFSDIPATNITRAQDRKLAFPWMSAHWLEDNYIKVNNFDSIHRTEDLNLGWNLLTRLGYSPEQISDDDARIVYEASLKKALFQNSQTLWRFNASLRGYWNVEDNEVENAVLSGAVQWHHNTDLTQSWYSLIRINLGDNLTADQQITLGGETGLRGYPLNYQSGNRSVLLSVEKRYYWEYHLLQLFKVGAAAFYDIGHAWYQTRTTPELLGNQDILHNVGIGLRLAPSRANARTVIHLDLAMPINPPDEIDSVQWLMTVKNSF
ncbi:hypothetical protein PULV_a2823 [Pseudoalteromonas ulvae UL12]|uniref:BamA/TamA family outer membrane protein n=1 Tax=Pseudoalteromonas ulvae TaxID=107327 RepID=UPI00186B6A14|nr:BamA/TamA family outer membrane protein [Pseudoalteromonas ulvae]MBE0364479.1 hypothetical protein [Pseudoalteromonas ulvae UL12]